MSETKFSEHNPTYSISKSFGTTNYVVPEFQREYVWKETEIEQLIGDLEEAFYADAEKEYFLGTTVVFESDGICQLIDGQQRMTTFFIMLCAIAKKYKDNGDTETSQAFEKLINNPGIDSNGNKIDRYTLGLQYEDTTKCLANIVDDSKIPEQRETLPASHQNLYNAYEIITKKLDTDFSDFSEYKKFASYFINRVVFIQIKAPDLADALKIFETINQRGVGLNPLDLLKNMLFMNVGQDDFSKLNDKWRDIIFGLEKIGEKPLRFLRYYLTSSYDISDFVKDFQGIIKEEDIYRWLIKNNDKCHYKEDPKGFTDSMADCLNRYKKLMNPDDDMPGAEHLRNIKSLMGKSYRLHLVALLSAKGLDNDLYEKLYDVFETVIYYSVVNNIKSNTMEKLLSSWCPELRKVSNKKTLEAFVQEKIVPTLSNWDRVYKPSFMNLGLDNLQKYKVKAILSRINKYVDTYRVSGKDVADITEYLKPKYEIEHIMPRTCDDIDRYGITEREEYDVYKNRLGNLSLLEKTFNASAKNDTYEEKCKVYDNSSLYLTKSIHELIYVGGNTAVNRLNQELNSWDEWNKQSIDERQEMLFRLSKKVWVIPPKIEST